MFQHPEPTEGKTSRATPSAIKLVGLNCKHTVEFTRNLNGRNSYANKRLEQSFYGWYDTANVIFPHLIDICKHNINFHKIFSLYASKSLSNNYEKEGMMLRPVVGACRIMLIMRWILARKKPFFVYKPQLVLHDRPYTHFGCLWQYLFDILKGYIASDIFLATSSSHWVPYIAKTVP